MQERTEGDETALVDAARAGDIQAFDELARRYRQAVWFVARQHLPSNEAADDVTQDALLIAYKALPTLSDSARFATWMRVIARNRALRFGSNESRHIPTERSALDDLLLSHSRFLGAPQEEAHRYSWLHDHIGELAPEYRQAIVLYYFEDWPIERIASFYGLPITTLKWRLHHARNLLRKRIEQAEGLENVKS